MLDTDRFFAHLDYLRENPPAGGIIKAALEAYCNGSSSKSSSSSSSNSPSSDSNSIEQARPADWDNMSEDEQFKWEQKKLDALKSIFGMQGGVVNDKRG